MVSSILEGKIESGIYQNVDIDHYHSGPGLSSTQIKQLLDCPRKFRNRQLTPAAGENKKCLLKGQAFHTYFLEREKFDDQYYITDTMHRGTTKYKELVNYAETTLGKKVIFRKELEEIAMMSSELEKIDVAKKAIKNGIAEASAYWVDSDTNLLLRCRPDYYTYDFVLDLKSTKNSSPSLFGRSAINNGYHIQAAMYLDGMRKITRNPDMQFIFLAVEGAPDYIAEWYVMDDDMIQLGRDLYKEALKLYKKFEEKDKWPTYCTTTEDHQLCAPSWAYNKLEEIKRVEV